MPKTKTKSPSTFVVRVASLTDRQAIEAASDEFNRAVMGVPRMSLEGFREINRTLGYNLAKAVPVLLEMLAEKDQHIARLNATKNRNLNPWSGEEVR